jgi:putative ABC transport system permease protein
VVATVAVAGSTVLAMVAAVGIVSSSAARARSGGPPGADRSLPGVRRAVRDGLVVVVGVVAVLLVRRRAGAIESVDAATDFDALLAATPVLVGLAVGAALLWLIGPLSRLLATLGGHGRGLTPFLGFRRLSVQQRSARSTMLVVLLATAIAGFSTAVRTSIADAQQTGAQQIVGADAAIRGQGDGVPVPPSVVAAGRALAAMDAVAVEVPRASVLNPPDSPPVNVLAVELDAYRSVLGESATAPAQLDALDSATAGSGVVPAIVSRHWPGADRPGVGDMLEVVVGGSKDLEVVAVADRFPSLPADEPFVVVDLDRLQRLDPSRPLAATVLYLGELTASPEAIVAAVSEVGTTSRVLVRDELLEDLASDPFVSWVDRGLGTLAVVAVVAAVIAATAGLAITAPTRHRDLTLLAAMGLRSRQATALTALEHFLPAVLAVVAGSALALGLIELMAPALDLDAFAGGPEPVVLAADPWWLVTAGAVVVVAVALSTVAAVRFETSEGAGSILSAGEE